MEGHFVSDFSDTWDLVAGIFYFYDEYQTGQITFPAGNPAGNPVFDTNMTTLSYGSNGHKRDSWAAYAQVEYHFTDQLSGVVGGRYSYEKKYDAYGQPILSIASSGIPPGSDCSKYPIGTAPTAVYFSGLEDEWDNFAPRLGLNYQASDDLFLFGFWQRAYKSGGFNMNANVAEVFFTPFGPEQVDNYEVGFKSEWLENRLRVNGNVFFAKYKDVQRNILRPAATGSGVITFTDNAADIDSFGVELETVFQATDALRLYANVGYLDAEYADFCAELDGAETTTTPQNGRSVCGDETTIATTSAFRYLTEVDWSDLELVRAPEWDGNIGASYDLAVGEAGDLTIDGDWSYTSELQTDLLNRPRSRPCSARHAQREPDVEAGERGLQRDPLGQEHHRQRGTAERCDGGQPVRALRTRPSHARTASRCRRTSDRSRDLIGRQPTGRACGNAGAPFYLQAP